MARDELLQGTLDMLILAVLNSGPKHGFAIADRIHELSSAVLTVEEGSLYPALYRMERRGWIEAEWGVSVNNRKAKFYRLTKAGRRQYETESAGWKRVSTAIEQVMQSA
jgi:transcriptional regulator